MKLGRLVFEINLIQKTQNQCLWRILFFLNLFDFNQYSCSRTPREEKNPSKGENKEPMREKKVEDPNEFPAPEGIPFMVALTFIK